MTDPLMNIVHPDPWVERARQRARAKEGAVPNTGCPHPMSAIVQFVDYETEVDRNGRPTNLWQCDACHGILWLVDANGNEAHEG